MTFERLRAVLARAAEVDEDRITPDTRLRDLFLFLRPRDGSAPRQTAEVPERLSDLAPIVGESGTPLSPRGFVFGLSEDSLDLVEFTMVLEEELDFEFPDVGLDAWLALLREGTLQQFLDAANEHPPPDARS